MDKNRVGNHISHEAIAIEREAKDSPLYRSPSPARVIRSASLAISLLDFSLSGPATASVSQF